VYALRNKFAHRFAFDPSGDEVEGLLRALREMTSPFLVSYVPASQHEMAIAIASICGFLERRARELGAPNVDST